MTELQNLLKSPTGRGWLRRPALPWLALALLLVLALIWYLWRPADKAEAPRFETAAVERGTLTVTVSATGQLQPIKQVDVGSELSGIVHKVHVEENDRVSQGQELARLDTARLEDQVMRARALLAGAEAGVRQAEATLAESTAQLARLREVARLSGGKVPAQVELEAAEAAQSRAEASLVGARAAVAQAQAGLRSDETSLTKASIRSPINGVVLARRVEPGQTVAASLQAPVLFTLAEDLARMELRVNVDEADVGQVRAGQSAQFTVDAYPGRKYPAKIQRVSYGSQVAEGVVSYATLLKVDNDDLSLRPGMTATAEILTLTRKDALLVPNAALRFNPAAANREKKDDRGILAMLLPAPPRSTSQRASVGKRERNGARQVWVLRDGEPVAVKVRTGASNGRQTEILEGELQPGMVVVTDTLATVK